MPSLHSRQIGIFDKEGIVSEPEASQAIENERRLFYVAITRARKAVYIAASSPSTAEESTANDRIFPSRFIEEMRLPETLPILDQLSEVTVMSKEGIDKWMHHVKQQAGNRLLSANLKMYLIMLGAESIATDVSKTMDSVGEAPFKYRYPYGRRSMGLQKSPKGPAIPEVDPWGKIK